ncbi:MAG: hypothetical protein JSS43_27580 [Proteobacteria bacterium]|nr:hypothetical protein [Pseudomonadota bacterium]MBS0643641.1 hypothetical protein [Pseudomonadota bacterium]
MNYSVVEVAGCDKNASCDGRAMAAPAALLVVTFLRKPAADSMQSMRHRFAEPAITRSRHAR